LIGLALIALGTGGIKPCVAAFGGDQGPMLKNFFNVAAGRSGGQCHKTFYGRNFRIFC
jgi:POT family